MAFDYRERRTVAQNRPKKQTVSTVVIAFALVIIAAYGLGVATGWLFFRLTPKQITVAKPANVQLPASGGTVSGPNSLPAGGGPQAASTSPAAPLTFYETLPKGEKAVMGSGLNPAAASPAKSQPTGTTPVVPPAAPSTSTPSPEAAKPASPAPAAPSEKVVPKPPKTPAQVPAPEAARPASLASPADKSPAKSAKPVAAPVPPAPSPGAASTAKSALTPVVPGQKSSTFAVQIASTKDRAEAERLRSRYQGKGVEAYVLTTELAEKGTWYRVRVGRRLSEIDARNMAQKLAGGAVVVRE